MIGFDNIWYVLIAITVLCTSYLLFLKYQKYIHFNGYENIGQFSKGIYLYKKFRLFIIVGVILFAISFGKPYILLERPKNIVYLVDLSYSMLVPDITTDTKRIEAVKIFIGSEDMSYGSDNFFLFGYTQIPRELGSNKDKKQLNNLVDTYINSDTIMDYNKEYDGSALGDALLYVYEKTKHIHENIEIIVLTDGVANKGKEFQEVLSFLKNKPVSIYTVGIGGDNPYNLEIDLGFHIKLTKEVEPVDETSLNKIAIENKGFYTRISHVSDIDNIKKQIYWHLENKAKNKYYLFEILFAIGGVLILLGILGIYLLKGSRIGEK